FNVGGLNLLTDDIALAANRTDNRNLAGGSTPAYFLIPVAVFILSADVSFVNLNFAHEFSKSVVLHGSADSVAHIPSCPVVTATDLAVNLTRADSLLALSHQVNDLEPSAQRIVGIVENSS